MIRPHGRCYPVDANGFLRPDAHETLVPPLWQPLVAAAVAAYQAHLGSALHSVYLRGSVPRGLAIPGVSDLDTFAVVDRPVDETWTGPVAAELGALLPSCTHVELHIEERRVLTDPQHWLGRVLSFQSVCVWGPSLIDGVPPYRPDDRVLSHLPLLTSDLRDARAWLDDPEEEVASIAGWIARRTIRSGMELVVARSGRFARDLWPCLQAFSEHYPAHRATMEDVVRMALAPTGTRGQVDALCTGFGLWLAAEGHRTYPERCPAVSA